MPTAISLFSGCGGSDAGLIAAGFDVVMANDILPYAKVFYEANLPDTEYVLGDVRQIELFPHVDLLAGCYPCQGFSQGGVRDPERGINYLYLEFARALELVQPRAFIVENVSGMVRNNFRHLLDNQVAVFSAAGIGYRVTYSVLNAAHYGVPQERKRIFIVGIRNDLDGEYEFPKPTHGPGTQQPLVSIRSAIADLPIWPEGEFYARDFHWYYLSRDRRRDWDEVSKTIVSNPRHMPLHPLSPSLLKIEHNVWEFVEEGPARRFSFREAARLQGFGANFVFPDIEFGTPDKQLDMKYEVVGNAVPPQLFTAVANALPNVW